ncbi:MAG: acylphosphatase [Melioribacteraceae bacterium]|nr:acylphosphatase [Melioribacteraceae bacterium]
MESRQVRVEIVVKGLVQGVGFRYFVYSIADELKLNGYVKNLYSGEVYTIVEGIKNKVEEFANRVKVGPMHGHVTDYNIKWAEPTNEFSHFEIRH